MVFRFSAYIRESKEILSLAPKEGRFIDTSLGSVFIQEEGRKEGQVVVLLHGTAAWSGFWRDVMDSLVASGYRVIAIDMPPFGFSNDDNSQYSTSAHAERIHEVLMKTEVSKAILVGHSFGCRAVIEEVLKYPEQITGLVLVSPALGLKKDDAQNDPNTGIVYNLLQMQFVNELIVSSTITNPYLMHTLLAGMLENKNAANERQVAILREPMERKGMTVNIAKWLPEFIYPDLKALGLKVENYYNIKIPVSIIWGDKDNIIPLDQIEFLHKLLSRSNVVVMNNIGHIPHIEAQEEFKSILIREVNILTNN